MTKHIRIAQSDRITINSISYTHQETNNDGYILRRVDQPDITEAFPHAALNGMWGTNALRYEPDFYTPEMSSLRMTNGTLSVASLDLKERDTILWKQAYCDEFLRREARREVKRTYESAEDATPDIKAGVDKLGLGLLPAQKKRKARSGTKKSKQVDSEFRAAPGPKTLLKWVRLYEKGGCHAICLREKVRFCGNFGSRLDAEAEAILAVEVAKYASELRPTFEDVILDVKRAVTRANEKRKDTGSPALLTPGRKAVRSAIDRLDPFFVLVMRDGRTYAEKHMTWVGTGLVTELPGQRIQIDEHQIDLVSLAVRSGLWAVMPAQDRTKIKRVRRWISVAICCATRVILGMRILTTPTKEGALATMKMVTMDKSDFADSMGALSPWNQKCGLSAVVCDWGSAYASADFRAALADAGATQEFPPAGAAAMRGVVERVFGTASVKLMARLHGRTWSDITRRGDYPSADKAGMTDDELAFVLVRYVVDAYHNTEHEGLHGETPANCWARLTSLYGVKAPPDSSDRRAMFGLSVSRTITNRGVRILGNYYRDSEGNELGKYFLHKPPSIGLVSNSEPHHTKIPRPPDLAGPWVSPGTRKLES